MKGMLLHTLLQKASIDKVKEQKMNFKTTFTQSLLVALKSRGQLVLNYLKHYFVEQTRTMIYKDDVIEKLGKIDLVTWMIKLKSNNTNQTSPFVSSLFAKGIMSH